MNAASSGGGGDGPFLHLKFGVGRPPPHEHAPNEDGSGPLLFAHEIELDPAAHSRHLHETLRTDVQRAGIARWLEQNFKEDAYIYDVVHRREGDRGMFALVTKNWARSVGDPKLHLSLYVYQDHMHVATWHAYSDRSVSYSRTGEENAPPPEGSDPYSTPEALEAAAAANLPSKEQQKDQDDGRPRFDRPAALPTDSSDLEDTEEVPFKPEEVVAQPLPPVKKSTAGSARSARKPQPQPLPEPEPESEASSQEEERQSKKSSRRPPAAKPESESESDRSSDAASRSLPPQPQPQPSRRSSRRAPRPPPSDGESPSSDEAAGPAYPIVKSQPLGKSRSGHSREDAESPSPPSPPSPKKKRSERGRDRTPVSPAAQSPSPPPAVSRKGETGRTEQQQQQRERSCRRARPAAAPEPEPGPSPSTSSPSRSPSPVRDSRTERGRRAARKAASASEDEQESEKPVADVRRRDRSARRPKPARSPSPSRSETPPTESKASTAILAAEAKKERVHERASRSEARSPSPPVRSTKTRSKRSTRQDDSEAGTLKTEDERPPRGRSRAPVEPTAPPPELGRKPSWRSVSRNRHRRNGSDSSGDDTLVRGDLVDPHLDIPAGGEATLLTAKRRASISEHSARRPPRPRRDDSFDPEEVQQPPRPADPPKPQTATTVLGNWIKSVGTLLKSEVEPAEVGADFEAEELEARMRRKAERAERRKARAARRAARQTDASAFEGSDGTAPESERPERSSRRRPQNDKERPPRRQTEAEEPASKPARPALRERAMSLSATLDSGFKNLRESVNKIVSGADDEPDSASSSSKVDDRRRSRRRSHSHKRRQNPVEESGPAHQRRRTTVEELPEQRQPRDGLVEERRSRSDRPEPTDAQQKVRERSRRREVEPDHGQDDPVPRQPEPRSKSSRYAPPPVTSPSDEDDALLLQRRAKESAHVRSRSTIDEDASSLPTRSSSRAAETSSRAARQTRQKTPRVDDSSSPERPSSRRTPRSDAPSRQPAERTKDREDVAAATRGLSAAADSGTAISEIRSKYVDRNAADRERARQDYEKERRGDNSVLRSRPSSTFQSPPNPSQSGHDDLSDEPPTRRRQVGQVALDHFAPVQQVRSSAAAFSPSLSTASVSTASDFAQQPRRSRPSTSRPATDADHGHGNLTDEEDESRFVAARGSSSTLTATPRDPSTRTTRAREREEEEEEGEYIPPIPAPASAPLSTRSSLPTYDGSGPLRPRPHRAAERQQQQKQPQPSFESGASRVPDSYSLSDSNSTWDGKLRDSSSRTRTSNDRHHTSLPRDSSFSRSRRPAFDPVSASSSVADSDSDSDSDSPDQDGEATSDPDSVAFGRRRRHDQSDYRQARVGDDWDDSRGRRGPSRRFGGVADDDDGTLLRGRPRGGEEAEAGSVRPLGPRDYDSDEYDYGNRSAAAATTLSNRPPSSTSAAASASSSRTTMFAAPDPSRTTTKSRTMVSPRPPPSFRMPEHPAASEMTDRGGWRDLQSASLRPQERPPLGLGSASHAAPREQGAGSSASFDRLTAKGRESGSVQLFGRHNAPVSRRMARRLGMS